MSIVGVGGGGGGGYYLVLKPSDGLFNGLCNVIHRDAVKNTFVSISEHSKENTPCLHF